MGQCKAIGIDLGTTTSCVGIFKNGDIRVIPNDVNSTTTPSWVGFKGDQVLVGDKAVREAVIRPQNVIYDAKRLIGNDFNSPAVQTDTQIWPFTVKEGTDGKPQVEVSADGQSKFYIPEQISSFLLKYLRDNAQRFIGDDFTIRKAVVTVPAYFNNAQRQATIAAARIAGIQVLQLLAEPTAAALAYALNDASRNHERTVLVFDLGGGTFDVSLLTIQGERINVIGTDGDIHLGGQDFSNRLVKHFTKILLQQDVSIQGNPKAIARLRAACESVKKELSKSDSCPVEIGSLCNGADFSSEITRQEFEQLNHDLFLKCIDIIDAVLQTSQVDRSRVDDVILVGGSSRIPKIRQMVQDYFNGKQLCETVHPDEAVARGAAMMAAILTGSGKGALAEFSVQNVTPLSLGIDVQGDMTSVVMPRNTPFPSVMHKTFYTVKDNQTTITFPVMEGERKFSKDNNLLGTFKLSGIKQAPRGQQSATVTFEIDINGVLQVKATQADGNTCDGLKVTNDTNRLSKQEIEKMIQEAQEYANKDEERQRLVQTKLTFENLALDLQSKLRFSDAKDRLHPQDFMSLQQEVKHAIDWIKTSPNASIDNYQMAISRLQQKSAQL